MIIDLTNEAMEYSADFRFIEFALEGLWKEFNLIVEEMESFIPRPVSDFDNERNRLIELYAKHNKDKPTSQIEGLVDGEIQFMASEHVQFSDKFSNRFSSLYITVSLLSHALCEAVINTILALGLCKAKCEGLFSIIEKVDMEKKWRVAPKSFCQSYSMDCSQAYWETLKHLIKDRNSLVHYKINLKIGGKEVLQGSRTKRISFDDQTKWIFRYFSLPYDLDEIATSQLEMMPILLGSKIILRSSAHSVTPRFAI